MACNRGQIRTAVHEPLARHVERLPDGLELPAVDELLKDRFGGIRIEDVVRVRGTDAGPEVLTADAPTDPDAVAAIVGAD